jgi:regulator of replication initiation timing
MKIKDTYVGIFFLIAIIIVIIFISVTTRYNESLSETTTNNYHSEFVEDSLKTEYTKKIISIRDSLIMVSEQNIKQASEKTNLLKKQIGGLKQENSRLRVIYSENHTLHNCDSVLSNQTEITNKQDSSILSLSNEVYELNNINHQLKLNNSSKDSLLSSKDNLNDMANKNIAQLKKELDDHNTWIIRNGYWITFAIGFVGGVFLALH